MLRACLWTSVLLALACGPASEPPNMTGGSGGVGGTGATGGDGGTSGSGGDGGTSGSGGSGGGNPNRVAASQVCQRLAEVQCAGEESCCTNAARKYPTREACISSQRSVCEDNSRVTQIGADPDAAYSIDHAETVFTEFERRASLCDPEIAAWGVSSAGLLNMFRGTKTQNADCMPASATDFGAGLSCRVDDVLACVPGTPGTSVLPPLAWTCKPRANVGGPCFSDLNCLDNLRCLVPETLSMCASRKSPGETCGAPNECLSLLCENNVCVEATAANVDAAYCLGG